MTAARIRTQFPIAVSSHQPSAISRQPSTISHQPSANFGFQPSAISQFRFPAISRRPSAITHHPSPTKSFSPESTAREGDRTLPHGISKTRVLIGSQIAKGGSSFPKAKMGTLLVQLDKNRRVSPFFLPKRGTLWNYAMFINGDLCVF